MFLQETQRGETCTWGADDSLTVSWKSPAIRTHPVTGNIILYFVGIW